MRPGIRSWAFNPKGNFSNALHGSLANFDSGIEFCVGNPGLPGVWLFLGAWIFWPHLNPSFPYLFKVFRPSTIKNNIKNKGF